MAAMALEPSSSRYPVARSLTRGSGNQLSFSVVRPSARAAALRATVSRSPFPVAAAAATSPAAATDNADAERQLPASSSSSSSSSSSPSTRKPKTSAALSVAAAVAVVSGPTVEELVRDHVAERRAIDAKVQADTAAAKLHAQQQLDELVLAYEADVRALAERHAAARAALEDSLAGAVAHAAAEHAAHLQQANQRHHQRMTAAGLQPDATGTNRRVVAAPSLASPSSASLPTANGSAAHKKKKKKPSAVAAD